VANPDNREMPKEAWEWLKSEAALMLTDPFKLSDEVKTHIEKIIAGVVPFGYRVVD
jgi:hypothetical protein